MHIAAQVPEVNLGALHTLTSDARLPSAGLAELAKLRAPFDFKFFLLLCWVPRTVTKAPLSRGLLQQWAVPVRLRLALTAMRKFNRCLKALREGVMQLRVLRGGQSSVTPTSRAVERT